ncbi:isoprenylcysteine carboxyl methyltransferase [Chondromyces crocatus]|uniref:Isoprenylcysteine carboxyl methyltransferase n=1 Tax=Chondromyces crocatus TaxID=52 RepID=A0A0K1E6Z1_CHOCO|nr:isoprenylcysteine carboxyl methyltransferase [Chondromyces crocatus]
MTSQALYLGFLGFLAVERLAELHLSSRNAAWAFARGGVEMGQGHYPIMAAFHTLFLGACATEVLFLDRAFPGALGWMALALAALAQGLRYWAVSTLGPRWNTRVIVVPGLAPVVGGPYRFLRHPNYVAVMMEMAVVPLIHGAWISAVLFSVGNALLLWVRIRAEERALGPLWADAFAGRPRFVPEVRRE